MNDAISKELDGQAEELIAFTQNLVRTRSVSDQEGDVARLVRDTMLALGYDAVTIDKTGNVVGRIGNGPVSIMFDSHMDTVEVNDADLWRVPPFSGEIVDGRLYGRGSVDMKGGLAASVFAGAIAKRLGYTEGKTVYVSGSVCEEYCDGENLKMLFAEQAIRPDYMIICEPSDNMIVHGHKGKAQVLITTHGLSAHGSAPEKGINAVYEMAEIIQRVEKLNASLASGQGAVSATGGTSHGTVVLSDIHCVTASVNAVPGECSIYLDRRMVPGETEEKIREEMDALIADKRASWQLGTLRRTTWTGAELVYEPLHEAWRIDGTHHLAQSFDAAFEATFGTKPAMYDFWDFSTNAVTPVAMDIPVIGFGPGEYKLAHMRDENCEVVKIKDACRFYTRAIKEL